MIQNITNSTNQITATSYVTITPIPTNTNITLSINLSPTGIQQIINTTNVTNTTNTTNSSFLNSMISPIYSATPLPSLNSSRNLLANNNNFINLFEPYIIGIGISIVIGIILIGLIFNYLFKTKKNTIIKEDDEKYLLPSMSYSPKVHSKVKNIFQR